jgi:hypothetical protein
MRSNPGEVIVHKQLLKGHAQRHAVENRKQVLLFITLVQVVNPWLQGLQKRSAIELQLTFKKQPALDTKETNVSVGLRVQRWVRFCRHMI